MSAATFTLADLEANKTREKCYMLVHDKVYDVTGFLDEHPGGDEVIIEEGGRDATEAFEDIGHSDEARKMLDKMYIGDFKGEKSAKKAAKAAAGATATKASSGSSISLLVPLAVLGAYLAWRFLYA
ncbi:hypothetical protein Q5752_005733 [Cryptotrichosporon argae]